MELDFGALASEHAIDLEGEADHQLAADLVLRERGEGARTLDTGRRLVFPDVEDRAASLILAFEGDGADGARGEVGLGHRFFLRTLISY